MSDIQPEVGNEEIVIGGVYGVLSAASGLMKFVFHFRRYKSGSCNLHDLQYRWFAALRVMEPCYVRAT